MNPSSRSRVSRAVPAETTAVVAVERTPASPRLGLGSRRPVFRFVALFGLYMALFWAAGATTVVKDHVFPPYLRFNALVSGWILGLFEKNILVYEQSISGRFALTIERGCDAIEPSALFLAGVLAFPAPRARKVPGMLIGTLCLMAINLVRIISLYYCGVYFSHRTFEIMHVNVWQTLFIVLAILFWVLWAVWSLKQAPAAVRG